MSPRWKLDERGKLYSTRGFGVINQRINDSRKACPQCGKITYIYTRANGRFCTRCGYTPQGIRGVPA